MTELWQFLAKYPWVVIAVAGIALAGFTAWLRHEERLAQLRAGQDPDKTA